MRSQMPGITDLDELLRSMRPEMVEGEVVFCTVSGQLADHLHLNPLATFLESEGLTLVLSKEVALGAGLAFHGVFQQITLTVHSSLHAVGLTAVVATKLATKGVSANVIAACHHDHLFVPSDQAETALAALKALSGERTNTADGAHIAPSA